MTTTQDVSLGRDQALQLSKVLETLVWHGPITRAELAQVTGLTRSIVADRVNDLVEHGVLRSAGSARSTGGRRAALVTMAADFGHLLIAVVGFSHMTIAVVSFDGTVVADKSVEVELSHGPSSVLDQVIGWYQETTPGLPTLLRGILIGLPVPVPGSGGPLRAPPDFPAWDRVDVNSALSVHFGVPCWAENEVNMMAVGAHHIHPDRPDNLVFIKIGLGIGAGVISESRLHRGADGSAGDIGHTPAAGSVEPCRCGQRGCLGVTASGMAWVRQGYQIARENPGSELNQRVTAFGRITPADMLVAAGTGDRCAATVILRAGADIGSALVSIVNFFNPAEVIIGGDICSGPGADMLMSAIRQAIYGRALPLATRNLTVSQLPNADGAGVLGAAHTAMAGLFQASRIAKW